MRTATFLIIVILLALPTLPLAPEASAAPGEIRLVSVATDGTHSDYASAGGDGSAAVSADGGYVAFASFATTLVPGDTNESSDVFVRDVERGVTERVSVASDGSQASGASTFPAISADGRIVAFVSDAADLAPGGSGGRDVFVHDRETGQTERIHVTGVAPDASVVDGQALAGRAPSLSADGRYVAFGANLSYRGPDTFHYWPAMYVHDRTTGTTELVSLADDDSAVGDASWPGTISADGRFVTFASTAAGVTPDETETDWQWDYFVRDRQLGTTERVPIMDPKLPAYEDGGRVQIGGDGRFVAVYQPGVSHYAGQIPAGFWIYDRLTGRVDRREQIGDERTGVTGTHPAILTTSSSFSPVGDSLAVDTDRGMFILDLASGATSLITGGLTGVPVPGARPVISDGATRVVFEGDGVGLIPGYAPEWPHTDVFMLDRSGSLPRLPFAHDAFARTWGRTDLPVYEGAIHRTWMWGPEPLTGAVWEPYAEAPGGTRLVQYFDKSRMEITHSDAPDDGLWYVTNGLLAKELISGQMQVGDDAFVQRIPAEINVAGDQGFANGPTYATFRPLVDQPGFLLPEDRGDALIVERIDAAGIVTTDERLASHAIRTAFYDAVTSHNVAAPFWAFMNAEGVVDRGGEYAVERLFVNPFYATGRPLTEAYWADVVVAGTEQLVLIQCFERRCLTWTPGNEPGWRVEAGNVGRHYYEWRYAEPPQVEGQVLFYRTQYDPETEQSTTDLYTINADGTDERNLTAGFGPRVATAEWSPDGSRIAFITSGSLGTLYVMDADGANLREVVDGVGAFDWSADGSQFAVIHPADDDTWQLFIIAADGSDLRQITNIPSADAPSRSDSPDWSPDGSHIAFANTNRIAPMTWVRGIYVVNSDGTNLVEVMPQEHGYVAPQWDPQGQRILFSRPRRAAREVWGSAIYIARMNESEPAVEVIAGDDGSEPTGPTWSPDGAAIAASLTPSLPHDGAAPTTGTRGIHLINADTGTRTQITHYGTDPAWSPDGTYLTFTLESNSWTRIDPPLVVATDIAGRTQWVVTSDGWGAQWRPGAAGR